MSGFEGKAVCTVGWTRVEQLSGITLCAVAVETQRADRTRTSLVGGVRVSHDVAAELIQATLAQLEGYKENKV